MIVHISTTEKWHMQSKFVRGAETRLRIIRTVADLFHKQGARGTCSVQKLDCQFAVATCETKSDCDPSKIPSGSQVPGACNIVTPSFAEFVSLSRLLISKESKMSRVLTNHNRVFGHYEI